MIKICSFALYLFEEAMRNVSIALLLCLLMIPPDWAKLKRSLLEYEQTHIYPVLQAQHARLEQKISSKEREQLEKLRLAYLQNQKALAQWQVSPTTVYERNELLRKAQAIRDQLAPIQEKYATLLQSFAQERAEKKPVWQAEMNQIIDAYNAHIDNEKYPLFAKYNLGIWDSDDEFLLWKLTPTEAKAGGKED